MIALGSLGLRFSFPTRWTRRNSIVGASSIPSSVSWKLYKVSLVFSPCLPRGFHKKLQFQFAMILLSFFLKPSKLDFPSSTSFCRLLTLFFRPFISLKAVFRVPKGRGAGGGGWPKPGSSKMFFSGARSPIASLLGALILFYCRAWGPHQNVCCGARSPEY